MKPKYKRKGNEHGRKNNSYLRADSWNWNRNSSDYQAHKVAGEGCKPLPKNYTMYEKNMQAFLSKISDLLVVILILLHTISAKVSSVWSIGFYLIVLVWLILRIVQTAKKRK